MTAYPDASLIVAAYTGESEAKRAQSFLGSLVVGSLASSAWCSTEIASALAIKVRTRQVTPTDKVMAAALIRDFMARSATMLPIATRHFVAATRFLDRSILPLRGGDALHLAIAADHGATLWTLDRRMAGAGQALGLDARLLD